MKTIDVLKKLLSPDEHNSFEQGWSGFADEEIIQDLINHHIILMLDWSAEDEIYQLSTFLQARVTALSDEVWSVDADQAYHSYDKKPDRDRGDQVPFLLDYFEKRLKKKGYTISLLDRGQDVYWVAVSTINDAKKLRKLKNEAWKFTSLSPRKTRILYTIYCPDCKDMNVWDLAIAEPPLENECCAQCGKLLFDKVGTPLVPCERDYC